MFCVSNALMAKWIPVQERSRACTVSFLGKITLLLLNILAFISDVFTGYNAGFIIGGPLAGVTITYLGWQSNFYITGCFSLLVALLWIVLVFDTPKECPRISAEELKFIFDNTIQDKDEIEQEKSLVPPYFAMLKSIKAWAGVRNQKL